MVLMRIFIMRTITINEGFDFLNHIIPFKLYGFYRAKGCDVQTSYKKVRRARLVLIWVTTREDRALLTWVRSSGVESVTD